MRKTRVLRLVALCLLSGPMLVLALHVYVLRELMAALLFFTLLFWAITMPLFILAALGAASWSAIARLTARGAHLGPQLRHPTVRLRRADAAPN